MAQKPRDVQNLEDRAARAAGDVNASKSHQDAISHAFDAADLYMKALSITQDGTEKNRLRAKCNQSLDIAEAIREPESWRAWMEPASRELSSSQGKNVVRNLIEPTSKRKLSTREQIILLESAKLNDSVFPPWKGPPDSSEFQRKEDAELFEETRRLHLSPAQLEHCAGWKRPKEALSMSRASPDPNAEAMMPIMRRSRAEDLVQDATSDCSVVASLCAGTARAERGHKKLLSNMFYPYDYETKSPAISSNGKYILRLYFNGCARKVVIDDCLPTSTNLRSIFVVDRNNPGLLWPALVEKAYLKVRGGYDFPGSNSGTDLSVLTGWIPEQIFLHSTDILQDQLWRRLESAFGYGDVLLTIGTGMLTKEEQKYLGLAGEHDYAILDMKDVDGERQLLIKNPWSDSEPWKIGPQVDLSRKIEVPQERTPNEESEVKPLWTDPLTPGTFWMDFPSVFQYFENLYLNWNPGLFRFREDVHFTWDLTGVALSVACFATNPQYAIKSDAGGVVWLLLSKHLKDGDFTRPTLEDGKHSYAKHEGGFISLYAYKREGQRIFLGDGALERGPYVDSPNTLLKLDIPRNTTLTAVIAAQDLKLLKHNFTLSVLSRNPIGLSLADDKHMYKMKLQAAWTPSTAGGNSESPDYPDNPQYRLTISRPSELAVVLETPVSDLAVHVTVIFTNGSRVTRVRARDIICASGDYRQSCAVAEGPVEKGIYTIVCSTFIRGQLGAFTLSVNASTECLLKPLPSEDAGRFSTRSDYAVFKPGTERLLVPLITPRYVRVKFIAKYEQPRGYVTAVATSLLKVSLELGQGPYKQILATSNCGDFSDALIGVRLDDIDVQPHWQGCLWVVIERLGSTLSQREEFVEVEALSEEKVGFGQWGTGNG